MIPKSEGYVDYTYKQKTCEGCLPACFLISLGKKVTLKAELELLIGGFKRNRESYSAGIISAFAARYKRKTTVLIHNKYYYKKFLRYIKSSCVNIKHKNVDSRLLKELRTPFILYLNHRILRKSVHYPHFVVVEKRQNEKFVLIDPWIGRRKRINEAKIMSGVESLKNYLKFCPLVIKLN